MSEGRSKMPRTQERAIAALLSKSTQAAAEKAGVSPAALGRWLKESAFQLEYRQARRELVRAAVDGLQTASSLAVETLVAVAKGGKKDGDRVRAAVALLDQAFRGHDHADSEAETDEATATITGTNDVVRLLGERLAKLDRADLPTSEKACLTATLADALLRAIGVSVLDKRLEALQAVLGKREDRP